MRMAAQKIPGLQAIHEHELRQRKVRCEHGVDGLAPALNLVKEPRQTSPDTLFIHHQFGGTQQVAINLRQRVTRDDSEFSLVGHGSENVWCGRKAVGASAKRVERPFQGRLNHESPQVAAGPPLRCSQIASLISATGAYR